MPSARPTGWLPKQHGAWAMLFVPYVVGLIMASRVRDLTPADWTLGATWLIGYFAFNALSLTLKTAPKRRPRYRLALASYTLASVVCGLATLYLGGLDVLWWTPVYALLLGPALVLVANKKERSMASGVLTILASCGLMLVLRFGTPQALAVFPDAATLHDLAVVVAVTGYFIGTIWHVKALIRERNDPDSAKRSAAYHVGLAGVVAGFAVVGWLAWPWAIWAVGLLARAVYVPRVATDRPVRPLHIGLIEIGFSTIIVLIVAFF